MSETPARDQGSDQPPRDHPQDPAEGANGAESSDTDRATNEPQRHTQDPAEGGDDSSATG
jgi:hypothetical protein